MKFYLYQMYDTKLESWTFHQFMNASPEQAEFSIKSLSIKKPETLLDKQDCLFYCSGEVSVETGDVVLYEKRSLVFDYREAFKKAYPESKDLESTDGTKES